MIKEDEAEEKMDDLNGTAGAVCSAAPQTAADAPANLQFKFIHMQHAASQGDPALRTRFMAERPKGNANEFKGVKDY